MRKGRLGACAVRALAATTLAGGLSGAGWAQAPAPATVQPDASALPAEDIVVTGIRRSLETALETRRQANLILDGISADGIGRFPDLNLSESLQRVTGVQLNRNGERREGSITLRGLPEAFARTTVNGQTIANPGFGGNEGGGGFPFGILESNVVSGVDVIKAPTAALDDGGLSGIVNIRTASPIDRERALVVAPQLAYEGLAERFVPGGSAALSHRNEARTFGVFLGGSYGQQFFRRDTIDTNRYGAIDAQGTIGPTRHRQFSRLNEGDRLSLAGSLDWQPSPSLRAGLRGLYTALNLDNSFDALEVTASGNLLTGNLSRVIPVSAPRDDGAAGRTATHVRITNPEARYDSRFFTDKFDSYAVTGNLGWTNEPWELTTAFHYTAGERSRLFYLFTGRQNALAGGNGLTAELNTGGGRLGDYAFEILPVTPPFFSFADTIFTARPGDFLGNRPGRLVGGSGTNFVSQASELAWQADVTRATRLWLVESIQAGVKFRQADQDQVISINRFTGAQAANLTNADLLRAPNVARGAPFFDGKLGSVPQNWLAIDALELARLVQPVTAPPGAVVGGTGFVQDLNFFASANYETREDILAAYLMANLDGELGALPVRGNVGLRAVRTDRRINTREQRPGNVFVPVEVTSNFINWLPAANLIVEPRDDLVLRAAYSETIVRPNPDQFGAFRTITQQTPTDDINVSLGNPDLQPFTASSFDLAVEWYNRPGSTLALTYFRKSVAAFVESRFLCPADGLDLGFGPLTLRGTTPDGINCFTGNNIPITVTEIVNRPDSITVNGVEVTVQQNLDFLPAPWNGFGGLANYTWVGVSGGEQNALPQVSEHTVNLIAFYETQRFGMRAAWNYRSDYFLPGVSAFTGSDRTVGARSQLDLSANLNVAPGLSLGLEAFNVTNRKLEEFEVVPSRVRRTDLDGRTFLLKASWTLR